MANCILLDNVQIHMRKSVVEMIWIQELVCLIQKGKKNEHAEVLQRVSDIVHSTRLFLYFDICAFLQFTLKHKSLIQITQYNRKQNLIR